MAKKYDVIVLGGGPAGLTAGIYMARARRKVVILDTGTIGGQMIMSHAIANYPGLDEIPGYKISNNMKSQAKKFGCKVISNCEITSLDIVGEIKSIIVDDEDEYIADSIIIASGGSPRKLGIDAEEKYKGLGVSYCATCDGDFFTGKDIVVVGGGNTALEEAVSLTNYVRKVTLVHQFDNFQGYQYAIDEVRNHNKIDIMMESVLVDIIGDGQIEKVKIKNNSTNKITELEVSGVFIFIGYLPNSDFVKDVINTNAHGEIICDENMKTNIQGVFVAGDVRQKKYRQITTAVSDGTIAALSAIDYLRTL